VWATEVSAGALRYAETNVLDSGLGVRLVQGDLLDALPARLHGTCDLVVSNPPYVPSGSSAPREVLAEPHQAVFAGPCGDELLRRLAGDAPVWLAPTGCVALEIGSEDQADCVRASAEFRDVAVRSDLGGRPRVAWGRR
jgi:release factor glutamine methyltransferase